MSALPLDSFPRLWLPKNDLQLQTEVRTIDGRISKRLRGITISAIKKMRIEAERMMAENPGTEVLSLGQGIPSFPLAEPIQGAVSTGMRRAGSNKYATTFGMPELRAQIAGENSIESNEVFVTCGAQQALISLAHALLDRGDNIHTFAPGFPAYPNVARLADVSMTYTPLSTDPTQPLFSLEDVQRHVENTPTKMILICNPNNPTGQIFSEADLESILKIAVQKGIWVVIDDPYSYCVYDDHQTPNPFKLYQKYRDNLIYIHSLSKEHAMTGFRIAYMVANPDLLEAFARAHDATVISAVTLSQIAALAALTPSPQMTTIQKQRFASLDDRRTLIADLVGNTPHLFEGPHVPHATYYTFPKLKDGLDDRKIANALLHEAQVILVPGYAYGPPGEGHLRACFGYKRKEIVRVFKRIQAWAKAHSDELRRTAEEAAAA